MEGKFIDDVQMIERVRLGRGNGLRKHSKSGGAYIQGYLHKQIHLQKGHFIHIYENWGMFPLCPPFPASVTGGMLLLPWRARTVCTLPDFEQDIDESERIKGIVQTAL